MHVPNALMNVSKGSIKLVVIYIPTYSFNVASTIFSTNGYNDI